VQIKGPTGTFLDIHNSAGPTQKDREKIADTLVNALNRKQAEERPSEVSRVWTVSITLYELFMGKNIMCVYFQWPENGVLADFMDLERAHDDLARVLDPEQVAYYSITKSVLVRGAPNNHSEHTGYGRFKVGGEKYEGSEIPISEHDRIDHEIALLRLDEIKKNPELLVRGEELKKKLEQLS